MWPNPQENADLVIFTEDILNGKLHILRSDLVEKGNLKLAESIFNSIEVSSDIICSKQNEFSKSYKMAVSFKLNNADFSSLLFPSASECVSSS